MSLRIDSLHIRVTTARDTLGATLKFEDGLNILRAENSLGKSTCMQSIMYGLGLEGSMGPSHTIPLTPAVTRAVEIDGEEVPVLESAVFVSISNRLGKQITIKRTVKSEISSKLVSIREGDLEDALNGKGISQDYYLRIEGGATRAAGFHTFLESFIGWDLPEVPRFDGGVSKLYLEALFPLVYIEQKRGWAAIQANQPTYLGIKDSAKRAIEFLLSMDAFEVQFKKQRIYDQIIELRGAWRAKVSEAETLIRPIGGRIANVPREPTVAWPSESAPSVEIVSAAEVRSIGTEIENYRAKFRDLDGIAAPIVGESFGPLSANLVEKSRDLYEREQLGAMILQDVRSEEAQLHATDKRISDLTEDRKRYMDMRRLRELGSVASFDILNNECPTCHQSIEDSLLPQVSARRPFGISETMDLIESQLEALKAIRAGASQSIGLKTGELSEIQRSIGALREIIQSIRADLIAPSGQPSEAHIREKVLVQQRIENLQDVSSRFEEIVLRLDDLRNEHIRLLDEKARLPADGLSLGDKAKLTSLQAKFIEYEFQYLFSSFDPQKLEISPETYKPTREGYDIGFEASASDNVRIIWGYLLAFLNVGFEFNTNHPRLLMMDEPRQQEARKESFSEFLNVAATALAHESQIIIATSEDKATLDPIVSSISCNYIEFDQKIIDRISG